jgi:hypothetical protein
MWPSVSCNRQMDLTGFTAAQCVAQSSKLGSQRVVTMKALAGVAGALGRCAATAEESPELHSCVLRTSLRAPHRNQGGDGRGSPVRALVQG